MAASLDAGLSGVTLEFFVFIFFGARTGYFLLRIASTPTYIRVYLPRYISQRLSSLSQ